MARRKATQTIEPPPPPPAVEPEPPSPEPAPALPPLPPPPFPSFIPRQRVIPPSVRAAAKRKLQRIQRQDRMATYQENLIGYVKEQLQLTMTPDQERMLKAISKNRRVAIKGSHAIGKTIVAAIVVSWWFDCWDQHIAYISAPTWQQALGLTFKQLKTLRRQLDLPGTIQETGKILDEDKLKAGGHFIQAINAETQEGFLGEHSAPILIVLEESPGVPAHIWAATDGLMTSPGCRLVALGNPTDESTPFGKVCTEERGLWEVIEVSALDHPNIAAELKAQPAPYPNAVRLIWLKEMLEKECTVVDDLVGDAFRFWSVPSLEAAMGGLSVTANPQSEQWCYLPNAVFQGRALGQFPTQAFEQVIPRNWLTNLARIESPHWTPEVGVDPARHGDDRTTILVRRGPCVMSAREIRRYNLDAVTGAILDTVRDAAQEAGCSALSIPIRIDVTGGLGAGPCDRLAGMGYMAEGVNSSSTAFDSESFVNRRSELWFSSRDRIYARDLDLSRLPDTLCKTLTRELSTPKWKPNGRGQKVVDPKEATKRTLGASPDLADAFNLAFSPSALQPAETEIEDDPFGYETERY